jgi:GNAT superfamily N-acetyltransferase
MYIRSFHPDDTEPVSRLVRQVFDEHVAPTFEPEGIAEMHAHFSANAIAERAETHLTLVALSAPRAPRALGVLEAEPPGSPARTEFPDEAWEEAGVVGVIEVRDQDHVSMLFVKTSQMGRGIATTLMARAEREARAAGKSAMRVHSSLNAESFYRMMGFAPTGETQKVHGFAFVPMKKKLRSGTPRMTPT